MVGLNVVSNIVNRHPKDIPVICLMGPTATGKTDAAAQAFELFDAEIISVDSSLVYKGMNIGTAKPDADFLKQYPHHLVDVRDPNDTYSAADFYSDTYKLINEITGKGKVPILAGGSMFYFNVLEHGLSDLPKADAQLREKITRDAETVGWSVLHERLASLDPQSAKRIDSMDAQRIQRALEIVLSSGLSVADHNKSRKKPIPNPMVKIALSFSDRAVLHERIERRFDIMLEQGLQSEVEQLLNGGVNPDSTAMKMIGYRQMLAFLGGQMSYDDMRFKGVVATRQLAKRQLTWLRNQRNLIWWIDNGLENKQFRPLMTLISHFLQ